LQRTTGYGDGDGYGWGCVFRSSSPVAFRALPEPKEALSHHGAQFAPNNSPSGVVCEFFFPEAHSETLCNSLATCGG